VTPRLRLNLAIVVLLGALAFVIALTAGGLAAEPGCIRVNNPAGVYVDLNDELEPQTIGHLRGAIAAGAPRILHLDRAHADAHRAAALRGHPPRAGLDRDEYPPAFSLEGGASSDVVYIDPTDNRRAGARMGAALRAFCDGQAFILEP